MLVFISSLRNSLGHPTCVIRKTRLRRKIQNLTDKEIDVASATRRIPGDAGRVRVYTLL